MKARPSLILLRLELDRKTPEQSNDGRTPGCGQAASSAARETIQAVRSVRAEGLDIDVVFCPPRTHSVSSINALMGEFQGWPRTVVTERLLDVPAAWYPKHQSKSVRAVDPYTDDCVNLALPQGRSMTSAIAEFYATRVVPLLANRETVLLAGSTESLAQVRRVVEGSSKPLSDQENFPSGQPLVFKFDRKLQPLYRGKELHWTEALHFRVF